jgi:hypothetical protein
MTVKRFQALEEESETLKKIAEKYPHDSNEYLAIEHAAFALAFAVTEEAEKFSAFIRGWGEDLTDEQEAHIKSLGLDTE